MRNRYFVCYDVRDPKRLTKTYKQMHGYGDPAQYSIFVCELSDMELTALKEDLGEILNLNEDRVLIINTGGVDGKYDDRIFTMGVQIEQRESTIVI